MTSYGVRRAVVEDADRLGVVHVQVWREAYVGVMSADYLAGLDPERSAARWRERLSSPAPRTCALVGTADGEIVGLSTAGPTRDDPPDPPHELYAINVLAAHHGTGLSGQLFEQALAELDGDEVSLWVVEANGRARAFYRRYGFAADGTTKGHDGTGVLEERWVRPARRPLVG